jgi:hypothetical protein
MLAPAKADIPVATPPNTKLEDDATTPTGDGNFEKIES